MHTTLGTYVAFRGAPEPSAEANSEHVAISLFMFAAEVRAQSRLLIQGCDLLAERDVGNNKEDMTECSQEVEWPNMHWRGSGG